MNESTEPNENAAETDNPAGGSDTVPIVAIGASAGGLSVFRELLHALPGQTGLAFVLIQHLDPTHDSKLSELLGGETKMPVTQAEDGATPEADHVYIIPPDTLLRVEGGKLRLTPRPDEATRNMPIDVFCRSLAEQAGNRAVGVVLSGTASDGTEGLRAIKEAGGVSLVQSPETAEHEGMPHSAIKAGVADMVLSPEEIAQELTRIGHHPYVLRKADEEAKSDGLAADPEDDDQMGRVFRVLRAASGVDFSQYKPGTIQRRLRRRMMLHRVDDLGEYLKLLEDDRGEVKQLYEDMLIHVTRFFRDPDTFEALETQVCPKLIEHHRDADDCIRVWVPGCSTGEEAYSAAIVLLECLGDTADAPEVQVFATDVSDTAIETARSGHYREAIASDVSDQRLRRYFTRTDGGYRVNQTVRDVCVFARQDLTRDPPFSRIDLLLCRNVLIYMGGPLQKRLLQVFHYALRPTGFLMLGTAESPGAKPDLFTTVDKQHRVYARKHVDHPAQLSFNGDAPRTPGAQRRGRAPERLGGQRSGGEGKAQSVQQEANRLILSRYGPPGVVVDEHHQVIHVRGSTGPYLEPSQGDPSHDLLRMAREGLLHPLRTALQEAARTDEPTRRADLLIHTDGQRRRLDIEVTPLQVNDHPHFLILFHDAPPGRGQGAEGPRGQGSGAASAPATHTGPDEASDDDAAPAPSDDARVHELERDLQDTHEQLQAIIQDREATNEELQSANEEMLSSNEELQSTNEELDTAREELQATNEELNSLNNELHARNEELNRSNSDLVNLLDSTQIAIVIVDMDLKVRRFTGMAEDVLNLIDSDVGRPVGHINPNLESADLEAIARQSIDQVTTVEREARDKHGNWYALRVRPYKSPEHKIEGAVLSLFDITAMKQHETQLNHARKYAEAIIATVRDPLVVLDGDLRVRTVSRSFRQTFEVAEEQTVGQRLYDLGNGQWDIPDLRRALEEVLQRNDRIDDYRVRHTFPVIGDRTMRLNARRLEGDPDRPSLILLAFEDVTGRDDAPDLS